MQSSPEDPGIGGSAQGGLPYHATYCQGTRTARNGCEYQQCVHISAMLTESNVSQFWLLCVYGLVLFVAGECCCQQSVQHRSRLPAGSRCEPLHGAAQARPGGCSYQDGGGTERARCLEVHS